MAEYTLTDANEDKIRELENGSAFTWEGMNKDEDNLNAIVEFFKENTPNVRIPLEMYTWSGKTMNDLYGLHGANRYPDDLTFISLPLNNWEGDDIGKLAMIKLRVGARWLDDIVDNNAYREGRPKETYDED